MLGTFAINLGDVLDMTERREAEELQESLDIIKALKLEMF